MEKLLSDIKIPWKVIKSHCYQDESSNVKIKQFYEDIVNSCLSAGLLSIPQKGISSKRKTVPGWKDYVEPYRKRSLMWHDIWKENGRPQSGFLQFIRNKTRTEYQYCFRYVEKNSDSILTEKLGNYMANKKVHSFWAKIKKIKSKSNNLPLLVDSVSGESNIANLFSEKYKKLFSSVSYDKEQMSLCISISVSDICYSIKQLKHGKSDGNTGCESSHIINGPRKLSVYLCLLFMKFNYIPGDMLLSTIIPIPKIISI